MSQAPTPDNQPAAADEAPKRAYHAPELRDLGTLVDLTRTGVTATGADNTYVS